MNNNPVNQTNTMQPVQTENAQPVVYAQPIVYAQQPPAYEQPKKTVNERAKKLFENTNASKSWVIFILSLIYGTVFSATLMSAEAKGAGLTLLVLLYYCFFGPFIATGGGKTRKTAWLLLVPVMLIGLAPALTASVAGRTVAVLLMLVMMPMQLMLMGGCTQNRVASFRGFIDIFRVFFGYTFANIGNAFRSLGKGDGKKGNGIKIFLGLIISIPVVIILVSIFAGADAAFAHFVDKVAEFINFDFSELVLNIIFGSILAVFIFSTVLTLRSGYSTEKKESKNIQIFDSVITPTVLFTAAAVYLIFVIFQIEYLFVGAKLPAGLTYAEYAHKGVWDISLAIFFTFVVCAFIRAFAKKNDKGRVAVVLKAALSLITLATFVICISAFYRMFIYINAYGLTTARIAAVLFVAGLTLALVALVVAFWIDKIRIAPVAAAIVVACICLFNLMNVDRIAAKVNVDRYINGHEIDIEYIAEELSCGTMPEVKRLWENARDEETKELAEGLAAMYFYDGNIGYSINSNPVLGIDLDDWTLDHEIAYANYKAMGRPQREAIEDVEDYCNRYYYW